VGLESGGFVCGEILVARQQRHDRSDPGFADEPVDLFLAPDPSVLEPVSADPFGNSQPIRNHPREPAWFQPCDHVGIIF
jgi:hypothetical protein